MNHRSPGSTTFLIIWMLALPCSNSLLAQNISRPILCGNEIFQDILNQHYPALLENFNSTFEQAKNTHRNSREETLELNVVVHVVWNAEAENLDDSIILDQINVLNNDFNRLNADSNALRNLFKPIAGNPRIHFNVEEIVRVQTGQLFAVDVLGSNLLPEVKHDADGGSDAWDPSRYINIWVCKIQPIEIFGIEIGQILGFSFPPNNLSNWPKNVGAPSPDEDGLVIDYRVFGSNNPNFILVPGTEDNLVVKGRTPVHEMGHFLGLRHIWGDGSLLEPNDCAQSDGIEDTPYAMSQSNFDCDTTKNTCAQVENYYGQDVPDLIENYMDYASEDCMTMFTRGQADLMRGVLQGPRAALVNNVSLTEQANKTEILYGYPMPVNDLYTFRLTSTNSSPFYLRMCDISGKLIFEKKNVNPTAENEITVDLSGYISGMYLLEIRNGNKLWVTKVIKQ